MVLSRVLTLTAFKPYRKSELGRVQNSTAVALAQQPAPWDNPL